ncbi:hypothetical protein Ancab_036406 [Ancistrocladus abbreviatus]
MFVPPTRSDVLHPCDMIEDVGIAFGYNEIPKRKPMSLNPLPLNELGDLIRSEIFEVGDAPVLNEKKDVGATNCRQLAELNCGAISGFEVKLSSYLILLPLFVIIVKFKVFSVLAMSLKLLSPQDSKL